MRHLTLALGALLIGCGAEPEDDDTASVEAAFEEAHAVFAAKCGSCHVTDGSGGHNIGAADIDAAYDDSQLESGDTTVGEVSLDRILNGTMPPGAACTGDPVADEGTAACLTADELDLVEAWVDAGQPR